MGGLGMSEPNDFYLIWEILRFSLTEKALFQVILGLLLVYADWEKYVSMSKSVYVRVSWLRIIEKCSSLRDRTTALISHWDE